MNVQAYASDKTEFLKKLEEVDESKSLRKFISTGRKPAWPASTRPDLQIDSCQITPIAILQYEENITSYIKCAHTTICYAKTNISQLKAPKP